MPTSTCVGMPALSARSGQLGSCCWECGRACCTQQQQRHAGPWCSYTVHERWACALSRHCIMCVLCLTCSSCLMKVTCLSFLPCCSQPCSTSSSLLLASWPRTAADAPDTAAAVPARDAAALCGLLLLVLV
jgi:hypothetical protein